MVFLRGGATKSSAAGYAVALALASGCYAGLPEPEDSGEGGGDGPPAELQCEAIGGQGLRRISSIQYAQILTDLLPSGLRQAALDASLFPRTDIQSGFSTYASANTVNTSESILIEDNAEAIAGVFYEGRAEYAPALLPCLEAGYSPDDIDGCIEAFVDEFGARAFRRPLTEGERSIALTLYQGIADADGQERALAAVLQYFLQAPAMLYVVERESESDESFVPLSPSELAVRLALLFLSSAPDDALVAAVADGKLTTRADVEREARRLVEAPEATRAFAQFHHEWMVGFELETAERDHPLWTEATAAAMKGELGEFAMWFLAEGDGTFESLMTTDAFPRDERLAAIYEGGGPSRRGLLSTAAAMAANSHETTTSLIKRAAFIRNHVLCIPVPPLPGDIDVDATLGGFGELPTARERLSPLMTEPACSGCHATLNPLGFPFEAYDWAGAFRTTENDATIDISAELNLGSISGTFADAGELVMAIAATDEARDCYATHWTRYALGRPDAPEDQCALDIIKAAFAESNGDIRELLVQIAISDPFMFRKAGVE